MPKIHKVDLPSREKLSSWIAILQKALAMGFRSGSSPTEELMDMGIDICLLLRDRFLNPRLGTKVTQGIKFLENAPQDDLGNTRSIRVGRTRNREFDDPDGSSFFTGIASILVDLKAHKPLRPAFLELVKMFQHQEPPAKPEKPSRRSPSASSRKKKKSRSARFGYYERQRRRTLQ